MAMHNKGLTKLIEECGELVQIAAKQSAFMDTDFYPDGTNMRDKLYEEIGDVLATIEFVKTSFNLHEELIQYRVAEKLAFYIAIEKGEITS